MHGRMSLIARYFICSSCSSANELNVQYRPNPTFDPLPMHCLLDCIESGVKGLLGGQVDEAEIAVFRVATEPRTMDHEYARGFEQVERKLLVGSAGEIFRLHHQVKRGFGNNTAQAVNRRHTRSREV